MERYVINGGHRLAGEISIQGAKNAVLPVLAASVISGKISTITNIPNLRDVDMMIKILDSLGAKTHTEGGTVTVDSSTIDKVELPEELVREMRSSIIIMGAMLARFGEVKIAFPGGCEIGLRPIDLHLKGLRQMGAIIYEAHGFLDCKTTGLKGCEIQLDYPSVGATENIMLAAVTAEGTTTIINAAREPELIDLQNYLNNAGAKVIGAGSSCITIEGVKELRRCDHTIIPDRIVAGTYMTAAVLTGGELFLKDIITDHILSIIAKLKEAGAIVYANGNSLKIIGPNRPSAIEMLQTLPYPGFPTDMQAQIMTLLTIGNGTSIINETIFENRFKQAEELLRMGANIKTFGKVAVIKGVKELTGAKVSAKDLRGGASLVLAGLIAKGTTEICNIYHINRGYDNMIEILTNLGADIRLEK
ncbi:UDP-N-acetylglucosamine 1-carboxyvinyltransferase [Tissierella creatinini]|nr:UDP-N-acetylglucosamine 1-carboxyvinyltransferase [Tissierella creatinini]TJX64428.1 UDP-N-acetylglucosamine 1-carboxyvinyltransferase [Soehngenia saccharolytica]